MKRWENRVEQIPASAPLDELVSKLNEFGEDGWEACTMSLGSVAGAEGPNVPTLFVHLKREKLKQ